MRSDKNPYLLKNKGIIKNCDILNFGLFGGKLWYPGQK